MLHRFVAVQVSDTTGGDACAKAGLINILFYKNGQAGK
jgi:hypothetical protein